MAEKFKTESRSKNELDTIVTEEEKKENERLRAERSQQFDRRVEVLANQAVDRMLEYGEEDYLTQMLTTFLDLAIQLKEMVKSLSAINLAMECLDDAVKFMDDSMNMDELLMKSWRAENYGFFARLKKKREMKKAIRNNVGRIQTAVDGLMLKYQMATDMTTGLQRAMIQINEKMKKQRAKKKKSKNSAIPVEDTPATRMIREIAAKRMAGGDASAAGASASAPHGPSAPVPPAPPAGSSDVPNIDDI